jgi:dimethylargininase
MPRAYTRAVSPRLAECQLTHLERTPIDATKAAAQHANYEAALAGAGFEIVRLPELADDPDAVFVEDTALLLDGHAIITRPGAASRIGEVDSTASGLAKDFELHRIEHGHVDGGDVLRIGKRLYVGLSTRTDAEGITALADLARPLGFDVVKAALRDCLHLKTGATFAGQGVLLYNSQAVDPAQFAAGCSCPQATREQQTAFARAASPSSRSMSPSFRRPKPASPA